MNMTAESGDGSFENVLPYNFGGPPGITEEQRVEFQRATQIPLSPIPSQRGDDDLSETTMTMLNMMMTVTSDGHGNEEAKQDCDNHDDCDWLRGETQRYTRLPSVPVACAGCTQ